MPHVYLSGSTSSSQSIINDNRLTSSPDPLNAVQNDLDAFGRGNFVLVAPFTDDEDENNPPNYFSNPEPLSPVLDEEVITRTGEASRLRRRGALHGRRRQLNYMTLSCGVDLPWRFKFEGRSGEKEDGRWNSFGAPPPLQSQNGSIRSGKLPLEYPSTGCRAVLTDCASISSHRNVYSATQPIDSVTAVDEIYVDEEQKEIIKGVLADICNCTDWKPVACSQCGNVVGIRYSQSLGEQHGNHFDNTLGRIIINCFAFFPSTVTSSKPYNFAEEKFYPEPSSERAPHPRQPSAFLADQILRMRGLSNVESPRFEPLHRDPVSQDGPAAIQVRLPPASWNQSTTHTLNTRPMPSENLLPSIPEGLSTTESTQQENADIIWGRWLPNPYAYSSETENGETVDIDRELERRRLGLSEAISILQTTHQEFMASHRDSYDGLEPELHPTVDNIIVLRDQDIENINQPSNIITSGELTTQVSNPYPYTHLSPSAPVPLSISTRARDLGRPDQNITNDSHPPSSASQPTFELLTTNDNDLSLPPSSPVISINNARPSDQTLPLPAHLSISYDSPAAISDIETSNSDTGAVENIGIMVEVSPPPQNLTSNFGSAVVVPSIQRHSAESTHPTSPPNHLYEQETNHANFGFDASTARDERYPAIDQQYPGFEHKIENVFNMDIMAGQLPNAVGEVGGFDSQLTNSSNVFREYTPSLSPLSPGALATPSLPYSPTTSVPLPPTLLPLIEILDSFEMEVLPLARHSDLEDSSDTSSQISNTDSNAAENHQQNVRDESVYTTELPWDCYDPDPSLSWLDSYEEPPFEEETPITWLTEPIESILPFSTSVFENTEVSE